jgi:adenosylcobinamide-GDP ribazoletransferase
VSPLLAALRLLTILPVGRGMSNGRAIGLSPAFFPLVGALTGGVSAGTLVLASEALPVSVAAALALAAGVIITGAMHIDGLADCADGLFNAGGRERRLEIMSDPRTGAFGATAIGLSLLIKWAAISALMPTGHWPLLIIAAMSARFAVVPVMALFRYARAQGIGSPYSKMARWTVPAALALTILGVYVFDVKAGPGMAVAALGAGLAVAWIASRRLGGVTGDVYGAAIEIAEIAALLTAAAYVDAGTVIEPVWRGWG